MSWFIAARPAHDDEIRQRVERLHGPAAFSAVLDDWYFACGGLSETVAGEVVSEGHVRMRAGLDLRPTEERLRITAPPQRVDESIQAGLVEITYRDGSLSVTADPGGIRTAYASRTGERIVVGTRLDWIAALTPGAEPDFEALGSHWRCHNQLSWRSLVRNVRRLPAGGSMVVDGQGIRLRESPWIPDMSARSGDMEFALREVLDTELPTGRTLSLGLSGGLDSRVLATLAYGAGVRFHTFGREEHPDVAIALRVAAAVQHEIRRIDSPLPETDEVVALVRRHASLSSAVAPASAAMSLRHYDDLRQSGHVVIDGGFGEIGRRQFMNRLLTSRRSIADRSPLELAGALRHHRADVFTPECTDAMIRGAHGDIEESLHRRPDIDGWTDADQADLVAVRYRLPNFFGFEQARLDHHVASFMPFATPRFLNTVFSSPMRQRAGGRSLRRIVRDLSPAAARIPLVKGTTRYPFALSPLAAFAWTAAKSRLGLTYRDPRRGEFLERVKPYLFDLAHSTSVMTAGIYDVPRIHSMLQEHFAGTADHGSALDWWLAFELWRQALSDPPGNAG